MWGWLSRLWGSLGDVSSTLTPADKGKSSGGRHTPAADCAETDQGRLQPKYLYSADGKPVGIANTTSKYKESRPLRPPHLTPFEARVTKMQQEEERLMTASGSIKAGSAAAPHCCSNGATAKKLFAASDPAAPEP